MMSSIAAIYRRRGQPVQHGELHGMLDCLARRGPSVADCWQSGPVGLGHASGRTDVTTQPLVSADGQIVISTDARIDNRDQLCLELGWSGTDRAGVTDAGIILTAYERWGVECVEHLLGDFALIVWDARNRRIFCARDHMGIKPLYYFMSADLFMAASRIKPLLSVGEAGCSFNEMRIVEFMASRVDDAESTFYSGVLRLPAAHWLMIDAEGHRLERYWALDPGLELKLGGDEEYFEQFGELFHEAVRCRMLEGDRIGSFLSGGLDSSSIACVARDVLRSRGQDDPLNTYSAVFTNAPECNEQVYIDAVLAQGGFRPNIVDASQLGPLQGWEELLEAADEPYSSYNYYYVWELMRRASEQGVNVLLSGFDGDSTISHGKGYLVDYARQGRWLKVARELRARQRHYGGRFWGYFLKLYREHALQPLLRPLRRPNRSNGGQSAGAGLLPEEAGLPLAKRLHYRQLTWPLMCSVFELEAHAGSAHGIELRFPFFDRRLVEFCLALPVEYKIRNGTSRYVVRKALADVLPRAITARMKKSNVGIGFKQGLRSQQSNRLKELFGTGMEEASSFLDAARIRQLLKLFDSGGSTDADYMELWRAAILKLWLDRNLQASAPSIYPNLYSAQ